MTVKPDAETLIRYLDGFLCFLFKLTKIVAFNDIQSFS